MDKPFSIRYSEFVTQINNIIMSSQLPPCVVADCLKLIQINIENVAGNQLKEDLQAYSKDINEQGFEELKKENPGVIDFQIHDVL